MATPLDWTTGDTSLPQGSLSDWYPPPTSGGSEGVRPVIDETQDLSLVVVEPVRRTRRVGSVPSSLPSPVPYPGAM